MTQPSLFDVCARKHKGNRQSKAANITAAPWKPGIRRFLIGCILFNGREGATAKELTYLAEKPLHAISGRLSEAKRDGLIFDSGRVRDGCAVLVGRKEWAE